MGVRIYWMFRLNTCVGVLILGSLPMAGQVAPGTKPVGATAPVKSTRKSAPTRRATKQKPSAVPPQVSTPVPIAPMTPEQLPATAPRVRFANGILTVDSDNSTLGDLMNLIGRRTGAQIDPLPGGGGERVAAHMSGPPRQVISSLLSGSNLGYIIVGSPDNPGTVQKVILTTLSPGGAGAAPSMPATAANRPAANIPPPQQAYSPDYPAEDEEPQAPEIVAPDTAEQPPPNQPGAGGQPLVGQPGAQGQPGQQNPYVGGEQPRFGQPGQPPQQIPPPPGQNPNQQQIKTPEQLLQELQRLRQQQQQQQQQQNPPQ